MRDKNEHLRPAQVVARRVVEARESRGWTQTELADRLTEIGYPKSRSALTKLEGEKYRGVSIDDVFALAAALGISPVHLLTPLEDEAQVAVTKRVRLPAWVARAWIRGQIMPPMLIDVDLSQIPESELRRTVREVVVKDLGRGMKPLARALMKDKLSEKAEEEVDRIVSELRKPLRSKEKK